MTACLRREMRSAMLNRNLTTLIKQSMTIFFAAFIPLLPLKALDTDTQEKRQDQGPIPNEAPHTTPMNSENNPDRRSFFIEAFGQYGYLQAPTSPSPDNSLSSIDNNTKLNYAYPNTAGFTTGIHVGYMWHQNLGLVVGYEHRRFSWSGKSYYYVISPAMYTGEGQGQERLSSNAFLLGLRPQFELFQGLLFANLGFALILPFNINGEWESHSIQTPYSSAADYKTETISGYNLAPGLALGIGYQYAISSRIYVSVAVSVLLTMATNNGKSRISKSTYANGKTTTSTTNFTDSYSLADYAGSINSSGTYVYQYSVIFPNDVGVRFSIGYRI